MISLHHGRIHSLSPLFSTRHSWAVTEAWDEISLHACNLQHILGHREGLRCSKRYFFPSPIIKVTCLHQTIVAVTTQDKGGLCHKRKDMHALERDSHTSPEGTPSAHHSPLFSPYAVTHSLGWEAIRTAPMCLVVSWMAMRFWLNEWKHDEGLLSALPSTDSVWLLNDWPEVWWRSFCSLATSRSMTRCTLGVGYWRC